MFGTYDRILNHDIHELSAKEMVCMSSAILLSKKMTGDSHGLHSQISIGEMR